ncbi:TetR family transcriptional regulator [Nonomuraea angiospora]|uniref:TetR family transcriptional regulator n=1 Tax=Nonomuraea angiospora TaxID=46172 RepID=UPI0033D919A6
MQDYSYGGDEARTQAPAHSLGNLAVHRQGHEQTTGAQITAAAAVATKTFFNYFPGKEHVLFRVPQDAHRVPGLGVGA